MSITDNRRLPLASIRLYQNGHGDPVVIDHGHVWYDVLAETAAYGTPSRDAQGRTELEYLEGIGLVCRPFLNLKDTQLSHYAVAPAGAWEARKPATGYPRVSRLVMFDTRNTVTEYSATSVFDLPENPHVAFTFLLPDNPPDWDGTTYPPYFRVELGNGAWAIHYDQQGGALLRKVAGAWQAVMELPTPDRNGVYGQGPEESLLMLRCMRGRIGISVDFGKTYAWFGDGASVATTATIPAGSYTVRGRGGICIFGLQQLAYQTATYLSPWRNTFTSRGVLASPALSARKSEPGGTSVALADASTPGSGVARYSATLTPVPSSGVPFSFYRTPELYTVLFEYPVTTAPALGTYTTPFDGAIRHVGISKPFALDEASASVEVRREASEPFVWAPGRWPKVQLLLGHVTEDDTEEWHIALTGYIPPIEASQAEYNECGLAFSVENPSIRFKRTAWTRFTSYPLGGRTLNQALDKILLSEGLNASYRSWHAVGDRFILDAGLPEEPFEYPSPGESKWDTMVRLAGYAGLEIGVTDDGVFFTVPRNYVAAYVAHTWRPTPISDLKELVKRINLRFDSAESATAVLVEGQAQTGELILGWAVDGQAEGNALSPRFCPWREVVQEALPGRVSPGLVTLRTQSLAEEHFAQKYESDPVFPVNLGIGRRDQGQIEGMEAVGITATDRFVVLALQHDYNADPSFATCETRAGLRRLN